MIEAFETLHGILVASPFVTNEDLACVDMPTRHEGRVVILPWRRRRPGSRGGHE